MSKDKALRLALGALKDFSVSDKQAFEATIAIKAALEAKDEPVAWISPTELLVMRGNALGGAKDWRVNVGLKPEDGDVGLYTTPPQRTWVGLTDKEIEEIWKIAMFTDYGIGAELSNQPFVHYARAIEAKLKEKNT